MRVAISAFSRELYWQRFKLHTDYSLISEKIKPEQPVGQTAQFKFESKVLPWEVNNKRRF